MCGVGDRVPAVQVMTMTGDGPKPVRTEEVLGHGKAILFGLPGAFTPTCSDYHLPGFVLRVDDLKAKGVETIACVSVNDPFVMDAWGRTHGVGNDILMLADADGNFTRAMGLETDASAYGLGTRSQRYAADIDDGTIMWLAVEENFVDHQVSTADAVLAHLHYGSRSL